MSVIESVTLGALKYTTPLFGFLGLGLAYLMYADVLSKPDGNERMREISGAIREGANAFLRSQFLCLCPIMGIVFLLIWFSLGMDTGICFLLGSLTSLLAGFLGMKAATAANVRTAQAASENRADDAFKVAFNGGAVMGLTVASLGVLGLGILFLVFGSPETCEPIIGFGVGASSVALFARVGGGIYTKAADVGADLVGKVEAGIPEDDPRNPGVIADNVGDNVGDVAGMGADIFESFVSCIIGCIALAATASLTDLGSLTAYTADGGKDAENFYKIWLMFTPIALGLLGSLACVIGIKSMSFWQGGDPAAALRKVTLNSTILLLILALAFFILTPINLKLWWCVLFGCVTGIAIGLSTEYYTGSKPVFKIVKAAQTGPATCIIWGISVGMLSTALPFVMIVIAVLASNYFGGVFGSAIAGVAMLSTVGIIMTIDAYGPIADNAGGISEMSHLGVETRKITDRLDAIGNTTAAIGKGFAIGSAGLTALSLFAAYAQSVTTQHKNVDFSITNPYLIIGVFIGAILPAVITALTMRSVGQAAGLMVEEIRRQFKEIPGLLEGKEGVKPDVSSCVAISTKAALAEMIAPGLVAALGPVLVGFLFGAEALGGLLLGTTVTGVLLGMFMSNTGGAWDNAKKFIEQGLVEGEFKGSPAHKAAVVGDTVGDPFKDTSGPSLNILIKMVSIISLLLAPLLAVH
jgi:K(+)-stimulated pyrophosphate-energized sodium pump